VVRADCLKFLEEEKDKYDLIVIDPPTLSRSKKMEQMFDVQLDYPHLIQRSLELLTPGGTLFFSTNSRRFYFDETLFPGCEIRNITSKTLPIDFKDSKIHHCWMLKP
jgi:23S rRNA (cytosine1962-C5)-methyltransferase